MSRREGPRGAVRAAWAATLALAALAVGACDVPSSDGVHVEAEEDVPFGLLTPSTTTPPTTTTVPVVSARVTICLFRDSSLVAVDRSAPSAGVQPALELLRDGATEAEAEANLTSALFDPAVVASVAPRGGVAAVDLGPPFTTAGPPDQLRIIAQVVCTMTAQPGVGQTVFTLGGTPVDVPRGDGSVTSGAVSRDDYPGLIGG